MIGFRKKSLPAMAPAGMPGMEAISVAPLSGWRALATLEFAGYAVMTEQLQRIELIVSTTVCRVSWRVFSLATWYADLTFRNRPKADIVNATSLKLLQKRNIRKKRCG